jgi:diguanylate cyclase (GGDEF)-like protein/PAS domain S-box-containing protein
MPNNWPIRRHLFALVLAIAIPMATLWTYSLQSNISRNIAEAGSMTLSLAQIAAADAQRFVRDSGLLLSGLARRPKVKALDPANCDSILQDFKEFLPQFANLAIADGAGTVVCSAIPQRAGKPASVAGTTWFKQVSQVNRYIAGHLHIGPISKKWVSVLAYPVQDDQGRFIGAIGLPIDLVKYRPLPDNLNLPAGTAFHIVQADGTIIAASEAPEQWVGKPFPDREVVSRANQEKQGQMWTAQRLEGKVFGYAPIAGTDWFVVSSVPIPAVLDNILANAAGSGGALLAVALLSGLLAYYLGRRIVMPIIGIAGTAKAVAEGDLNRRAEVAGPLEIEDVAHQFNAMLDVRLRTEQKYRNLLETATDAIVIVNDAPHIIFANAQAERLFGFSSEELIGQPIETLIPQRFHDTHAALGTKYVHRPHPPQMSYGRALVARRKDGSEFPVEVSLSPLMTAEGMIVSSIIRDVSERKHYEERLLQLAQYDTLTGLPNRHLTQERLDHAIALAEREGMKVAILLLDLVRFKQLNDTLGHRTGDRILQAVGDRLVVSLHDTCTITRPGSDEFLVMEKLAGDGEILRLSEAIQAAFAEPLRVDEEEFFLSVRTGIAVYPDDGQDSETLLKNADVALHHAKRDEHASAFYTPEMGVRAADRLTLENRLRRALPNNELLLHYQPQVDVHDGHIHGMEALVRWQNPERGLVPPDQFIGIAEQTGLIESFGEWILRTACAQNKAWQDMGLPPVTMAVNISARQFRQKNLIQIVRSALEDTGLEPRWLELEITESMLMTRPEEAEQTLHQITDMGVKVALDDFGTGYSSLAYLKRFPVHSLKIDRSFVRDIHTDPDDAAIVAAVISLAKSLDMGLVAEGVELKEQLDFLRSLDCELYQGYYFSKPVPAEQCTSMLRAAVQETGQRTVNIPVIPSVSEGSHPYAQP